MLERGDPERADVVTILEVLPEGHPARVGFARGTGKLEITRLVVDHSAMVEQVKAVRIVGYRRLLAHSGAFRP